MRLLFLCGLCVPSRLSLWLIADADMLLLAPRAIMRPASADHDLFDRGFAGQAGLAFAAIGAVLDLEEAGFAISIDVIGD